MFDITLKQILRETSLSMLQLHLKSVPINTFFYIKCSLNKSLGSEIYVNMLTREIFDVPDIYPNLFEVEERQFLVTGNSETIRREITDTVPDTVKFLFEESIKSTLQEHGRDLYKNDKGCRSRLHQNR